MGDLIAGALGAAMAVAILVVVIITGALMGGVTGWIVGYFFEQDIMDTLRGFGVDTRFTMWQLGVTLGFIGGFFRTTVNKG